MDVREAIKSEARREVIHVRPSGAPAIPTYVHLYKGDAYDV